MGSSNDFDIGDSGGASVDSYIASAPSIVQVGVNDAVTQYQNAVVVQLQDFTETILSVTLGGLACTITAQVVGVSVTVNLPGSLATGSYTVVAAGSSELATRAVEYTQTHPIACPASGTTIPGSSSSDPARALIYGVALDLDPYVSVGALPSSLQFKEPYASWTQTSINKPISQTLEPTGTAIDGDIVNLSLSVLKSDGSIVNTTLNIRIYLNIAHVLNLTAAKGNALQPITYTFPTGWIIAADLTIKLQNVTVTMGETVVTQDNVVSPQQIGDLTLGEFVVVMLSDVPNNLGAICPNIEVEAA